MPGKETTSRGKKTNSKGKNTCYKVKNTSFGMKQDSRIKRMKKEDPGIRLRRLFTSPLGFRKAYEALRVSRASRGAPMPVFWTTNTREHTTDSVAHQTKNELLGAPPSPPPSTERMDLHPQIPIFEIDASQEDYEKELEEFCFDEGRPVVLVRNLCRGVNLKLSRFSSIYLNHCAPHHTIDIREQVQQEAEENMSSSGRRHVWQCESERSSSSISEHYQYQVSQLGQPSPRESEAQRKNIIRFGTNLDLSDRQSWKDQLQELEKLPQFLRVASPESDFLAHVGHTVPGMNSVRVDMKVAGCRTPGHQDSLCSVNVNIGPGDCEWFAVDKKYWGVLHQLCKKRRLSFLTGSWWPSLSDLESRNIPVYRFTQKTGEVVWLNPGTVHWVQANSVCNNIAWNVGPITSHQFQMCWERYLWNKTQKVPSIVPMVHLAWNLVKSVKITDRELSKQLKVILKDSYYQTQLILKRCRESDVPVLKHDPLSGEPPSTCRQCSEEVFNILFVIHNSQMHEVYCHKCASARPEHFTVSQQFNLKDLECTYLNFLKSTSEV